jgi:hypothetical protein
MMYSPWMLEAELHSCWPSVYFPAWQRPWPLPAETGTFVYYR